MTEREAFEKWYRHLHGYTPIWKGYKYFGKAEESWQAYQAGRNDQQALYDDAKEMINSVYELVEIYWDVKNSPYNKTLKNEWLRKAKELHNVQPMP